MTLNRHVYAFPRRGLPRVLTLLLLAAALFLLAGCAEAGQMIDQPRYDTYEASTLFANGTSARAFQPGTIPFNADVNPDDPALTGLGDDGKPVDKMPVELTQDLVKKGRERYMIYCVPCHGAKGDGNGNAVTIGKFPKPPALVGGNNLSDGQIFNVITNGQNVMFPYGYRVKAPERWAVISYIRAMQAKGGEVKPEEITPELINQLGGQQ